MSEILFRELSFAVVGAAMEVYKLLGPGFSEEIYQRALEREISLRNLPYVAQQQIKVVYKDTIVADYFLDLVVDQKIVVELKAVSALASVHEAQVLSYLKASGLELGILINFGEVSLKSKRIAKSLNP